LVYDSAIWQIVTSGSSSSWQPTNIYGSQGGWRLITAGGATTANYGSSVTKCLDSGDGLFYSAYKYLQFAWTAPDGTKRVFPITTYKDGFGYCYTDTPTGDALAEDSSGYHMYVTNYNKATVYAKDGTLVHDDLQTSYTMKDPNGNYFYQSSGNVVDTLGRTVVTYVASGSGCATSYCYNILTAQGTQQIKVTTTTVNVSTNFQQSGVTEYSGSFTAIQSITLPDNSSYSFTYDSGTTAGNYGLIKTITLPTGGTVTYTWTTFADSSGSRYRWVGTRAVTPGGTWTYVQSANVSCPSSAPSGSTCQGLTVYRPSSDDAVYTFVLNNGGWNAQTKYYSGGGSTLLMTVLSTYDFSKTCSGCTGAAYIRKVTTQTQLLSAGGATVTNQITYTYDTVQMGDITAIKQWKYVSGSSPSFSSSPDRETDFTYTQLQNLYCANGTQNTSIIENLDRVSTTTVQVGGTQVAQTSISYDTTRLGAVTGITNHDDSCYGASNTVRGNPTLIQGWISGSSYASTTNYYDTTGQVTSSTDPNSNPATFAYVDSNAYLSSITKGGLTTTFAYDPNTGLVTSTTDPNNATTSFTYDSMNRMTATTFPDGGSIDTHYTSETEQDIYTTVISSTSRHDELLLDGLGRVETSSLVNDPDGQTYVATAYDGAGRVESVSNPYRGSSPGGDSFAYDGLDRPNSVTHADSNVAYTYYGAAVTGSGVATSQLCSSATYGLGFPILLVDEAGKMRESWADGLGRTIEVDEPGSSGSLTVGTCYKYDGLDDLIEVDQGSETRTYAYDGLSRLTSVATPETSNCAITYSYDGNGNITSRTAPKPNQTSCSTTVTTTYSYGPLNQLTGKSYSDGTTSVAYSYGATACLGLPACYNNGRRTGMSDASGQTAWSYDPLGRVWAEQRTIAGITKTISYTYNLDGSPYSVTYPSGRTITYAPSTVGRAVSAVDSANSINYALNATYASQGGLASVLNGQSSTFAGVTFGATYNNRLMPATLSASSSAGTALSLVYTYFPNLSVEAITNNRDNGRNQSFSYDYLNRISTAQSQATSGADCWGQAIPSGGYDRYGNLLTINSTKSGCSAPTLSVSVNTYNQVTNSGFGYDVPGNTTGDGTNSYTWDDEGRLTTVVNSISGTTTYMYDGDGKRVKKSSGTLYWNGLDGTPLAETDLSGNTTNEYVFFAGVRAARRDSSGNVYYYYSDLLRSSRAITTAAGVLCYDADFYPFGGELAFTNTCAQNYKFTGMERDPETINNDHTWFRSYASNLGRWLSADPLRGDINNPQSFNRYAYVVDNPCSLADQLGLQACYLDITLAENGLLTPQQASAAEVQMRNLLAPADVGVLFDQASADYTVTPLPTGDSADKYGNTPPVTFSGYGMRGIGAPGNSGYVFVNNIAADVSKSDLGFAIGTMATHELSHFLFGSFFPGTNSGTLLQENGWNGKMLSPGTNVVLSPAQAAQVLTQCQLLHPNPGTTVRPGPGGLWAAGGAGGSFGYYGGTWLEQWWWLNAGAGQTQGGQKPPPEIWFAPPSD
jgi:RHS repeat-associated protein